MTDSANDETRVSTSGDDPATSAPTPSTPTARELLARQNELLDSLRQSLAPDEIEGRIRKLIAKVFVAASFATGAVLGTWEFYQYLSEQWETRSLIANWVEVSRQAYEEDLNAEVALEFLGAAEELAPQSPAIVRLKAYIAGMEVAEELLNLDRPKTQEELDRAALAIGQANLLIQVDEDSPDGWLLKGQVYMALGDPALAERNLAAALDRDPGNTFALVRMGNVEWRWYQRTLDQSHLDEARQLYARAIDLDPGGSGEKWGRFWMGVTEMEVDEDTEAAAASFIRVLEIDPRFHLALLSLARLHRHDDDWDRGRDSLWSYLDLKPGDAKAWTELATQYGYQDKYVPALSYATRATEVNPESFNAWEMRSLLEFELAKLAVERTGEASESLVDACRASTDTALALDPANADIYIRRAKIERMFGDLAAAGENVRLAIDFAPDDPMPFEESAFYHLAIDDGEAALAAAQRAIELDPEDSDQARLLAARALRSLARLDEALVALEQAAEVAYEDQMPAILVERGLTLADAGDAQGADAAFVEAIEFDPAFLDAGLARLQLALATRDVDAAAASLTMIRSIAPNLAELASLEAAVQDLESPRFK